MAVVARFRDLAEAEVASANLEAAGIPNVLADTQTVGLAWYYSNALGGIRLYVGESDAAEAKALLETPAEIEWPAFPNPSRDERCPACGQFSLEVRSGPRKTLAVMTTFGVPLWFWRSKLRCEGCDAAERVPLRVRPELAMAWALLGLGLVVTFSVLLLLVGSVVYGRRG